MSEMAISDREFGQLSERVQNLSVRLEEVRDEMKIANGKMDSMTTRIETTFARLDGGWKVLAFLAGVAGAVGTVITFVAVKMWPFLLGTLPRI